MDARPPPAAPPLSREGQLAALQQQQAQLQGELLRQQQQQAAQLQANSHLKSLPIRAYLDQTVVPILLDGMSVKKSLSFSAFKQRMRPPVCAFAQRHFFSTHIYSHSIPFI